MILLETGNRILGETVAAQLKAPSVPPTDSSSSSSTTDTADRDKEQRGESRSSMANTQR
jgi:hypothetical protein